MPADLRLSRAALHMWEEPSISGKSGSGTVFFTGCNLHCIFCQNYAISGIRTIEPSSYKTVSEDRLAQIFIELQNKGANNINLVTGVHYIPHIAKAIVTARNNGVTIPFLYNSGGYENVSSLKLLDGLIDIYLPDFKFMRTETAHVMSHASDYPEICKNAIDEMFRQVGPAQISPDTGLMEKGLIIRHLVLPGHTNEAVEILKYLYGRFKDDVFISIMNQYVPFAEALPVNEEYPNLSRKVTQREYNKVVNAAIEIGIRNGYTQDKKAISESFIPSFDGEGIEGPLT